MKTIRHFIIFSFVLLISYQPIQSQSMSMTVGVGSTNYFDIIKGDHLRSEYGIGESYFLKVDFSNDRSTSIFSNFAFKIEKQSGDIEYNSSFIGCGLGLPSNLTFTDENVEKYTLSVITYPITLPITESIRFKAGFAANKSFNFAASSNYQIKGDNDEINFNSKIDNQIFSADAALELQFGSLHIGSGILMKPVYNAFIGLTQEFQGDYNTHSIRQSFGLSFLWGLKKK